MQQQSAIDFMKMMLVGFNTSQKVIIVLSRGYKYKADRMEGGVGMEYELIIKSINYEKNKFILVSLNGIENHIIPN